MAATTLSHADLVREDIAARLHGAGLSERQLSLRANLAHNEVSRILTGGLGINYRRAVRLAVALDLDPNHYLEMTGALLRVPPGTSKDQALIVV